MDRALLQGWRTPAQLFGYLAFALGVASFLQKNDQHFNLLWPTDLPVRGVDCYNIYSSLVIFHEG